MKWPYGPLGVLTTRAFRDAFNKLFGDIGDDMQEQKTRVDTLIQTTPQPSETVDMRTGRDSQTYPTARDMVLGEIGKTETAQGAINASTAAQLAALQTNIDQNKTDQGTVNDGFTSQLATKSTTTTADKTIYVDVNYNVSNGVSDGTSTYPYTTLQAAVNSLPLVILHNITINVASGSWTEDFLIEKIGYGSILIVGQGTNLSQMVGSTNFYRSSIYISWHGIKVSARPTADDSAHWYAMNVDSCPNVTIEYSQVDGYGQQKSGVTCSNSSVKFSNVEADNCLIAIGAADRSNVYTDSCSGTSNQQALRATQGSQIYYNGSYPNGSQYTETKGEIH